LHVLLDLYLLSVLVFQETQLADIDFSREVKRLLTSSHDAKVPFGMEVPYGHRNKFILRHK